MTANPRNSPLPEFEKPPKSPAVKMFEGCLIFALLVIVVGACCAILVSLVTKH
jgi:hypothetical protein